MDLHTDTFINIYHTLYIQNPMVNNYIPTQNIGFEQNVPEVSSDISTLLRVSIGTSNSQA